MKKLKDLKLKAFESKKAKNIIGGGQSGRGGAPGQDGASEEHSCEGESTEFQRYYLEGPFLSFNWDTYGDWKDTGCC